MVKPYSIRFLTYFMAVFFCLSFNRTLGIAAEGTPLTLDQAIQIANQHSLQYQLAEGEVVTASARLAQARSGYLPKITLNGGYTHFNEVPSIVELGQKLTDLNNGLKGWADQTAGMSPVNEALAQNMSYQDGPDDSLDYYGLRLNIEQLLYTGNKLSALNKQAGANHSLAEANREAANHNLVYEVKKAYYTVLQTKLLHQTMQEAVTSMTEHVKEANHYYQAGLVPKLDVIRAEVKLADLKQKLLMAENGITLAKMALNFTMGVDLNADFSLIDELKYRPALFDLQNLQQKALAGRPELKAISSKLEMAKQAVIIAKSGNKPIVALRAQGDNTQPYSEDPPVSVSLVASLKLVDGGLVKNQINEAENQLKQAMLLKDLIQRGIRLEVEQAYRNISAAQQSIDVAQKSLVQAEEMVRMAEVSYRAGLSISLELIDAKTNLTLTKHNYNQALSSYNIAQAQLEKAIGFTKEDAK